ncbi:MAG: U32 family peptidase [Candidatus Hodarchaeota archaeon]
MKLTVATNWDPKLIEELSKYPVYDVYGVSQKSIVGGGRPSFLLPEVSDEEIADYIKMVHDKKMKFSYLLNAPCMNNMEYNPKYHKKLIEHLQWISDVGTDNVIITTPFLMTIVKEQFPNLKIRVSTIAHVNSVNRAKFYEQLGASEITLDVMINRDFETLKRIKKNVKCQVNLLLTDGCLYQCPFRYYHYNILGHASQKHNQFKGQYHDFCIVNCSIIKFSDAAEVLKARWIRPEDLHMYEEIGIDHFKIAGRRMPTAWILRSVDAFTNRKYEGNLVDIIQGFSMSIGIENDPNAGMQDSISDENKARLYIDNTKLDGFLEFFKKQNCIAMCGDCDYCKKWADKAVIYNDDDAEAYVDSLKEYNHSMATSEEFLGSKKKGGKDKQGMPWNPKTQEIFDDLIAKSPKSTRPMAKMVVSGMAKKNAKKRGSNIVEDEDMVDAFLKGTPKPFQKDLRKNLKKHGFDVE